MITSAIYGKRLSIKIDYRESWLATLADGLYNAAGTLTAFNANATGKHLGESVDAQAIFKLTPKTTIGIGNLNPGAYLKQAGKTTGFVYPSLAITRPL